MLKPWIKINFVHTGVCRRGVVLASFRIFASSVHLFFVSEKGYCHAIHFFDKNLLWSRKLGSGYMSPCCPNSLRYRRKTVLVSLETLESVRLNQLPKLLSAWGYSWHHYPSKGPSRKTQLKAWNLDNGFLSKHLSHRTERSFVPETSSPQKNPDPGSPWACKDSFSCNPIFMLGTSVRVCVFVCVCDPIQQRTCTMQQCTWSMKILIKKCIKAMGYFINISMHSIYSYLSGIIYLHSSLDPVLVSLKNLIANLKSSFISKIIFYDAPFQRKWYQHILQYSQWMFFKTDVSMILSDLSCKIS